MPESDIDFDQSVDEADPEVEAARRQALGQFLVARRAALQPEQVGLPRHGRRRVKGLRRHEVADLAGVSVTWYTWLEQGRSIRTSASVLDAVARALKLDEDSRRHMRRLAGEPMVALQGGSVTAHPSLVALVDDLLPAPAYVMTPANDLAAWNRAYALLFGDPDVLPVEHRNGLWMMLFCENIRTGMVDWENEAEDMIAWFRAESGKFPGDTRIEEFVRDLMDTSAVFRRAWQLQRVARFVGHVQVFDHNDVGVVRMQQLELRPLDQPSLTLMVHRPADQESRTRLERLLA